MSAGSIPCRYFVGTFAGTRLKIETEIPTRKENDGADRCLPLALEVNERAWCVAPTGGFGGHEFTLPKGRTDGRSLAATALVEVFEELGLRVCLRSFLADVQRKETYTRFFLAERIGGSPAEMGMGIAGRRPGAAARPARDVDAPGCQLVLDVRGRAPVS